MPAAVWLLTLVIPIVRKALVSLGIGYVTYTGLNALFAQAQAGVLGNWAQMPAAMNQILTLSGFTDFVGITLGALSARLALIVVGRLGRVAS